jgi:hypothetical protein
MGHCFSAASTACMQISRINWAEWRTGGWGKGREDGDTFRGKATEFYLMVRCRSQVFFEAKYRAKYVAFDLTLFFVSVDPKLPFNKPIHCKHCKMITVPVTLFYSRYVNVPTCSQTSDRTLKRNMCFAGNSLFFWTNHKLDRLTVFLNIYFEKFPGWKP